MSETITALGLLCLVCCCTALSTGQLPFQTFHPVRIMFAHDVPPFRGDVSFSQGETLRERPVIRACWACNTVPVTLELFNHKRQGAELASHSEVS